MKFLIPFLAFSSYCFSDDSNLSNYDHVTYKNSDEDINLYNISDNQYPKCFLTIQKIEENKHTYIVFSEKQVSRTTRDIYSHSKPRSIIHDPDCSCNFLTK